MQIKNNTFTPSLYNRQEKFDKSETSNKVDDKISLPSQPAFKASLPKKTNIFKKILDFFKQTKTEKINKSENLQKFSLHPVLPFDGVARLKAAGVKEENIHSFLDEANGNKQHFGYLVRMKKDGFDENHICSIFKSCKNYDGQLKIKILLSAVDLHKSNVPDKYLKDVLNNFKISVNKFDYDGFEKFGKLRNETINKASENVENAFCNLSSEAITKYFYENIKVIKTAKKVMGEEAFLNLTELEPAIFDKTIKEVFYASRVKKAKPNKKAFVGDSVLPYK